MRNWCSHRHIECAMESLVFLQHPYELLADSAREVCPCDLRSSELGHCDLVGSKAVYEIL